MLIFCQIPAKMAFSGSEVSPLLLRSTFSQQVCRDVALLFLMSSQEREGLIGVRAAAAAAAAAVDHVR